MRTKDELLEHLGRFYERTPAISERALISINLFLEVLIDIRDLNQAHLNRLIELIESSD